MYNTKLIENLNRYSLLFHGLLACGICFTIEWVSRHSFVDSFLFMFDRSLTFLYNALIVYVSLMLTYLFHRRCLARAIISFLWLFLGIINGCILLKRVSPFSYTDLKMISDLFTMQSNYFNLAETVVVIAGIALVVGLLILLAIKGPKYTGKCHPIVSLISLGLLIFCIPMVTEAAVSGHVLAGYFENLAQGYKDNGFVYSFSSSVVNRGMNEPEGYGMERIAAITGAASQAFGSSASSPEADNGPDIPEAGNGPIDPAGTEAGNSPIDPAGTEAGNGPIGTEATSQDKPNIICVLLESFVDPSEINFLSCDKDPIPNFRALYNQYASGHLEVPVVGAGTANTEFEILTGMGMHYFGLGELPYKTILKSVSCESVASDLKALGYGSHVVHNNGGNFYSRRNAFTQMGFDTFTSKEMINIQEYTPLGTWPTDQCLIDEVRKAMDATPGQSDYVYTITVQGHGSYPTEKVLENPAIRVSGAATPEEGYAWEYYVNMLHEVDQFIGDLIAMLSQRDEKTVVVFFGDHLPTMGLTEADMATESLFQTKYVTWNNFGMEKKDRDLTSYQLMPYILDQLGIHEGTMMSFHQSRSYLRDDAYDADMEMLQYDLLYGERYAYGQQDLYPASDLVMGVSGISIDSVSLEGEMLSIHGSNFTPWSKVSVNGEKVDTVQVDGSTLQISSNSLHEGENTIMVQIGSGGAVFRTSNEVIFDVEALTPPSPDSQPSLSRAR